MPDSEARAPLAAEVVGGEKLSREVDVDSFLSAADVSPAELLLAARDAHTLFKLSWPSKTRKHCLESSPLCDNPSFCLSEECGRGSSDSCDPEEDVEGLGAFVSAPARMRGIKQSSATTSSAVDLNGAPRFRSYDGRSCCWWSEPFAAAVTDRRLIDLSIASRRPRARGRGEEREGSGEGKEGRSRKRRSWQEHFGCRTRTDETIEAWIWVGKRHDARMMRVSCDSESHWTQQLNAASRNVHPRPSVN